MTTTTLQTLTIAFAMNAARDALNRQRVTEDSLPYWHNDRSHLRQATASADVAVMTAVFAAESINDQGEWVSLDTRSVSF